MDRVADPKATPPAGMRGLDVEALVVPGAGVDVGEARLGPPHGRPSLSTRPSLAPSVPLPQLPGDLGGGVSTGPLPAPVLEVQVAATGVAGRPDPADHLAGLHALAAAHLGPALEVAVDVGVVAAPDVDCDVVAVATAVEAAECDPAGLRGDHPGTAVRADVLALVAAAGAPAVPVLMWAANRELGRVDVDPAPAVAAVAGEPPAAGLLDPEDVGALADLAAALLRSVPVDVFGLPGGDVVAPPALDHLSVSLPHGLDPQVGASASSLERVARLPARAQKELWGLDPLELQAEGSLARGRLLLRRARRGLLLGGARGVLGPGRAVARRGVVRRGRGRGLGRGCLGRRCRGLARGHGRAAGTKRDDHGSDQ